MRNNRGNTIGRVLEHRRDSGVAGLSITDAPAPHHEEKPEVAPIPDWATPSEG